MARCLVVRWSKTAVLVCLTSNERHLAMAKSIGRPLAGVLATLRYLMHVPQVTVNKCVIVYKCVIWFTQ